MRRPEPPLSHQIAMDVMGWERGRLYGNGNGEWIVPGETDGYRTTWNLTPNWSTSIEHAMKVVRKMRVDGWGVCIEADPTGDWVVTLLRDTTTPAGVRAEHRHGHLATAICLAALDAVRQSTPAQAVTP